MHEKGTAKTSSLPSSFGEAAQRQSDLQRSIKAERLAQIPEKIEFNGQVREGRRLEVPITKEQADFLRTLVQEQKILELITRSTVNHQPENFSLSGSFIQRQEGWKVETGYQHGEEIYISPEGQVRMTIYGSRIGQKAEFVLDLGVHPPVFILDTVSQEYEELSQSGITTQGAYYQDTIVTAEKLFIQIKERIPSAIKTKILDRVHLQVQQEVNDIPDYVKFRDKSTDLWENKKKISLPTDFTKVGALKEAYKALQMVSDLVRQYSEFNATFQESKPELRLKIIEIITKYKETAPQLKLFQNLNFDPNQELQSFEKEMAQDEDELHRIKQEALSKIRSRLTMPNETRNALIRYATNQLSQMLGDGKERTLSFLTDLEKKISQDFNFMLSFYPSEIQNVLEDLQKLDVPEYDKVIDAMKNAVLTQLKQSEGYVQGSVNSDKIDFFTTFLMENSWSSFEESNPNGQATVKLPNPSRDIWGRVKNSKVGRLIARMASK